MFGGIQTLQDMYKANFTLMHEYKYSLTELENMFPFEREIYLHMVRDDTRKKREAALQAKQRQDAHVQKLQQRKRNGR